MSVLIVLLFCFILFAIFMYCWHNKLSIKFKTFFRKGFHKTEDDFGLYCFTAEQGGGKTYSICDLLYEWRKKEIVISNVESYCERNRDTLYMDDFNSIVDFINHSKNPSAYCIFFDEIFAAIGDGKLNKASRRFLTQLRKRHLHVMTTCQDWGELPRGFRKLCRYQISCKMINFLHFGFAILINEVNSGYDIKWSNETQEWECPRLKTNIKKCSLKVAQSYDTYETINTGTDITR